MLVDDHRNHGEKYGQQGRERQRFGKGFTNGVFIGDAGKGGGQNNHRQANQPDFSEVHRQRGHQPDADNPLSNQPQAILTAALLAAAIVELL